MIAMPPALETALRCFVALLPDEATRTRLDALGAELQRSLPGTRRVAAVNLHLTLVFIGALPTSQASQLAAALARTPAAPQFDWALDQVGAFGGARVVFAGSAPDRVPLRLMALAEAVRGELDGLGISSYDRKPFVPHVTLLRNVARADAAHLACSIEPPVHWRASAPRLMQSRRTSDGLRYLPIEATPT